MKQRQKPIISVDINVIKLVRKSMCAIFVSLKEKLSELFDLFRLIINRVNDWGLPDQLSRFLSEFNKVS